MRIRLQLLLSTNRLYIILRIYTEMQWEVKVTVKWLARTMIDSVRFMDSQLVNKVAKKMDKALWKDRLIDVNL